MGIKYLNQIIKKHCKEAIETIYLNELFSKVISIDASIFLYKYQYSDANYLVLFLKQIIKLLKNGIIPYYVFDGKPPEEKNEVLKERKIKKEYTYAKIELLRLIKENNEKIEKGEDTDDSIDSIKIINISKDVVLDLYNKLKKEKLSSEDIEIEIKKQKKKIITVRKEHIDNLIELLDIIGIPYLRSNYEAEVVCAQLNRENIVNGCITEDSDYLTNCGNYLLRKFNISSNTVILYKFHILLRELDVTDKQFIDFCILCGCDYTSKITGIGPVRALQLIRKYKNIESIIEFINNNKTKYIIQEDFNYIKARELFKMNIYNKEELNNIKNNIKLNKNINIKDCFEYFTNKSIILSANLLREVNNISKYSGKIIKYKNKKKQQKLTNYFSKKNIITEEI